MVVRIRVERPVTSVDFYRYAIQTLLGFLAAPLKYTLNLTGNRWTTGYEGPGLAVGNHAVTQAQGAGLDFFMALANCHVNGPFWTQVVKDFIAVALEKHEQRGLTGAA